MDTDDWPKFTKTLMGLAHLNQSQFGKAVGVTQGTVSKWLSGESRPRKGEYDDTMRWARRHAKTKHLFGDEKSIDVLLLGYPDKIKSEIHDIVERILTNVPKP